jgi:hypothetical protein
MPRKIPRKSGLNVLPPRRTTRVSKLVNSEEGPQSFGELTAALHADLDDFDAEMIEMCEKAGDRKMAEQFRQLRAKRKGMRS